jgi:hypothetical protein
MLGDLIGDAILTQEIKCISNDDIAPININFFILVLD